MTKKGPLSKAEIFYIEQKAEELSPEQIAEALGRTVKIVKSKLPEPPKKTPPGSASTLMGRNEDKGVVVMTEGASAVADEAKKSRPTYNRQDVVTKIKRDDD